MPEINSHDNPLPPSKSRIQVTQEEATWLYNVIQQHVMEVTLKGPVTAELRKFTDLIKRIKYAAGI